MTSECRGSEIGKYDILKLAVVPLVLVFLSAYLFLIVPHLDLSYSSSGPRVNSIDRLIKALEEDPSSVMGRKDLPELLKLTLEVEIAAENAYKSLSAAMKYNALIMASLGIFQSVILFNLIRKQRKNRRAEAEGTEAW